MLEFVAIGQQGNQRWKKSLVEDKVVRLGRAPASGWSVPWDLRISREHCDMVLKGDRLYVRLLDTALNPAYRLGEAVKEFSIGAGEAFRIGQTTFRMDAVDPKQTIVDVFDDPSVQRKLRAAAEGQDQPAAQQRPDHGELASIRGQISDLKAQVEAGAKKPPSDAATRAKAGELDALRQQIEALKEEMSAASRVQQAAPDQPPEKEDDQEVRDLRDEIERLRSKVESQDSEFRKKAAELRKQPAEKKHDDVEAKADEAPARPVSDFPPEPVKAPDAPIDKPAEEPTTAKDQKEEQPPPQKLPPPTKQPAAPSEPPAPDKPKNPMEAFKARLAEQAAKRRGASKDNDEKKNEFRHLGEETSERRSADAAAPSGSQLDAPALNETASSEIDEAARPSPKSSGEFAQEVELQSARRLIWQALPENVRTLVQNVAGGETPDNLVQWEIVNAVNRLIKDRGLLASPTFSPVLKDKQIRKTVDNLPNGIKGIDRKWSELDVRAGMRAALPILYSSLPSYRHSEIPRRVVAYLSRGEIFGEIGALLDQPRSATCVAYAPTADEAGQPPPSRVELIRIPLGIFHEMVEKSPTFQARVEALVAERTERDKKVKQQQPRTSSGAVTDAPGFQELDLVQGQNLLLIDLDRCTRCGDCVQACINTHDDGHARMALEGPRIDRFLVPNACRHCLNPACMIGCPVGSIQRGEGGQIVIRDWCIGCGMCASLCPFDAIDMHDLGMIPEVTLGWRFTPASALKGDDWQKPRFRDGKWARGRAPFVWDLDMQSEVSDRSVDGAAGTLHEPICLRYHFQFTPTGEPAQQQFRLSAKTDGRTLSAWVNARRIDVQSSDARGVFTSVLTGGHLRPGDNVLAVKVDPPIEEGKLVMSLRLDALPEMRTATNEMAADINLVSERAVVCDLCRSVRGGPACVTQCPHDAAIRVDARYEFPV